MTTAIKLRALPAGMTLTIDVTPMGAGSVLETVTCTESGGVYSGDISAALAGQFLFVLKNSGTIFGSRVGTIYADAGPYYILTANQMLSNNGYGPYLVTITVDDGTDELDDAFIRITGNGVDATGETNGSGIAKFGLPNGTYDVVISKPGYEVLVETLVVSGVTPETYSLTEIEIAESDAGTGTGWAICYDEHMVPEVGVPHTIQMIAGPGDAGRSLDQKTITVDSGEGGLVEFERMLHGATYSFYRGEPAEAAVESVFGTSSSPSPNTIVVPVSSYFPLVEVLGIDAAA